MPNKPQNRHAESNEIIAEKDTTELDSITLESIQANDSTPVRPDLVAENVDNSATTSPDKKSTDPKHANPIKSITSTKTSISNKTQLPKEDGYKFGYNRGYIDGQNNAPYEPYLPKNGTFTMAYRQTYCQGYDAGYQKGQSYAGRSSYHVNTGDEPMFDDYDYDD